MKSPYLLGMTALALVLAIPASGRARPGAGGADRRRHLRKPKAPWKASSSPPTRTVRSSRSASPPTRRAVTPSRKTASSPATTISPSAPSATTSARRPQPTSSPRRPPMSDIKLDKTKNLARPAHQCRMDDEHPRHRRAEGDAAQLHQLPHARTHRASRPTTPTSGCRSSRRMMGYGAVSQPIKPQPMLDQSRAGTPEQYRKMAEYLATINLSAVDKWALSAQDAAAPDRPLDPRHRHRIRRRPHRPPSRMTSWSIRTATSGIRISARCSSASSIRRRSSSPNIRSRSSSPTRRRACSASSSTTSARSGSTPCTRARSAVSIRRPARSNTIRSPPSGTTTACSSTSPACTTRSTARCGPRASAPRTSSGVDLKTGKWEKFHPTDQLPGVQHAGIYQVIADSQNNLWMAEFTEGHLGKIDAKTGEVTWYATPTAHARARRMEIDDQDRILVTEYRTNKVGAVRHQDREVHRVALPRTTPIRTAPTSTRTATSGPRPCRPTASSASIRRPARPCNI